MRNSVKHCVSCETPHTEEADEDLRARLAAIGIKLRRQAPGRRRLVEHGGTLCSRCLTNPPLPGQRYCAECHAAASREYRTRANAKRKALMAAVRAAVAAFEGARS